MPASVPRSIAADRPDPHAEVSGQVGGGPPLRVGIGLHSFVAPCHDCPMLAAVIAAVQVHGLLGLWSAGSQQFRAVSDRSLRPDRTEILSVPGLSRVGPVTAIRTPWSPRAPCRSYSCRQVRTRAGASQSRRGFGASSPGGQYLVGGPEALPAGGILFFRFRGLLRCCGLWPWLLRGIQPAIQ